MKKLIALILTLTLALCAFCACADSDEGSSSVADSSAAESSESTETSEESSESSAESSESSESSAESSESSVEESESADVSFPQNGGDDALVGTWYSDTAVLKIEADGTGTLEAIDFGMTFGAYWGVVDGVLYFTIDTFGEMSTVAYDSYEVTDETLIVTLDGADEVYSSTPVEGEISVEEISVPEEIDEAIVGTWEAFYEEEGVSIDIVYTFNADGSASVSTMGITASDSSWGVADGKIVISLTVMGITSTESMAYSLDGDTLTITDDEGIALVFTKQ